MPEKALKIIVDISIGQVTCPGVRFNPNNGLLRLRICALGFHTHTSSVIPHFPLEFNDKLLIERTFPLCKYPGQILAALTEEQIAIDLVQLDGKDHVILATFRGSVNDFFFSSPPLARSNQTETRCMDTFLDPAPQFAGLIGPRVAITTRVVLRETNEPLKECKLDHATNLTIGVFGTEHPNYATWYKSPNQKTLITSPRLPRRDQSRHIRIAVRSKPVIHTSKERIKPFLVRHVDPKLIERTPGMENVEHPPISPIKDEGFLRQRKFSVSHRSSSSLETLTSLDRRLLSMQNLHSQQIRPDLAGSSRPEPEFWCEEHVYAQEEAFHHQQRKLGIINKDTESEKSGLPSPNGLDLSPKGHCPCCVKHHRSGTCTVCKLYRQYFGMEYPAHHS